MTSAFARAADLLAPPAPSVRPWWALPEDQGGAREAQKPPPGDWLYHLILAGRGWGKTVTGAQWLADEAESAPNTEWAIMAPTFRDARTVCTEGPAGILKAFRPGAMRAYNRATSEIALNNGSKIYLYGGEDPRVGVRGKNLSGAWLDELAAFRYAREVWDEALLPALRIGSRPRVVITTTPRPTSLIKELASRADGSVFITRGNTFENARNLSPVALEELKRRYEGTRLGRQELYAEILDDVEGALWTRAMIEAARVREAPEMRRVVVAIDPAVTSGENADETGIIVAGAGIDGLVYILADRTCRMSPRDWARRAVTAFGEFKADRIVAEVNNGGDLVAMTLRTVDANVPYKAVHASRGKRVRAEPVAALYEQERIKHVGSFPALEDQMASFTADGGKGHDDRVDALVWACTELALERRPIFLGVA